MFRKKILFLIFVNTLLAAITEKPFVIIIPSYNNQEYYQKNLSDALDQEYENYRIIYIEDASTDNTKQLVEQFIENHKNAHRITCISNNTRKGALENLYTTIHTCNPWEIIVCLDGDDWLYNRHVLEYLNAVYRNSNVWMTYGQFIQYPANYIGWCKQIAPNVIQENSFRDQLWISSHLRTFYAWLFQAINKSDLQINGEFFPMAWDLAMMFPMLEMAGTHSKFIEEILYVYNRENNLNDEKIDQQKQLNLGFHIRSLTKYKPLQASETVHLKWGKV
ncbi:MAG: glycosyltransferase family 2 protein [Candidatus Babeliaceae bacterium]|jgi:glycosyltransferase involved in cell wall biosynthesis